MKKIFLINAVNEFKLLSEMHV